MHHFCSHYYEQTEFPIVYIIIHYGSGAASRHFSLASFYTIIVQLRR